MEITNYQEYLKSDYWKIVREMVRIRDGKKCCQCETTKRLTTHHTTYEHLGNELEHLEDLITLCWKCHRDAHIANPGLKSGIKSPKKKKSTPIDVICTDVETIDTQTRKDRNAKRIEELERKLKQLTDEIDRMNLKFHDAVAELERELALFKRCSWWLNSHLVLEKVNEISWSPWILNPPYIRKKIFSGQTQIFSDWRREGCPYCKMPHTILQNVNHRKMI